MATTSNIVYTQLFMPENEFVRGLIIGLHSRGKKFFPLGKHSNGKKTQRNAHLLSLKTYYIPENVKFMPCLF
jgi:hypothetical protein